MKESLLKIREWYFRYERLISSLSLLGGFVFDALTLTQIDRFWDNLWVVGHFIIVGTCIIIINYQENKHFAERVMHAELGPSTLVGDGIIRSDEKKLEEEREHFWLIAILQFFFGGLLSTFLVFYFRSGTLSVTWPFLLLLAAAFVANEVLKKHYSRLVFQISLFFLSLFCFAIFIVPVIVHQIGPAIFILSGLLSILALWLFIQCLRFFAKETFARSRKLLVISVSVIFVVINVLYFFHIIPPLPLSIKDGGVYHSLTHAPGGYIVTTEDEGLLGYFSPGQTFHEVAGGPVYAHTAIFSPASLDTTVVHEWQMYATTTKKWITKTTVKLTIVGGRSGGYNTYSEYDGVTPGQWRVNVETSDKQIIGRLGFTVIGVTAEPVLVTELKN